MPAAATTRTAGSVLTPGQRTFAARLAQRTGLDPQVIAAWLLAEESGGAAHTREAAGNHDWLNIGYTDTGPRGTSDPRWRDPNSAADLSAAWLQGRVSIPGFGKSSPGIRRILLTAGHSPATQIAAIQRSGWATSGYPDLPGLFHQAAGAVGSISGLGRSLPGGLPGAPGGIPLPGGGTLPIPGAGGDFPVTNPLKGIDAVGAALTAIVDAVTSLAFWIRLLEGIGGLALIWTAVHQLSDGAIPGPAQAAAAAPKVVPV